MKSSHQPLIFITSFFSLGIVIGVLKPEFLSITFLVTIAFLIASIGLFHKKTSSTVFLLLAIAGLGAITSTSQQYSDQNHIRYVAKYYRNNPVTLKGVIVSDVQGRQVAYGTKQTFTLMVDEVLAKWGWQKRNGKVLVNNFKEVNLRYGDYVQLEGKLHRPFNFSSDKNFSYQKYLQHRGIHYLLSVKKNADIHVLERNRGNTFKSLSLKVRERFTNILSEYLSVNESGIMRAILLGDRSSIQSAVRLLFVQTGTAHILAISGLHIGVVAGLFLIFSKILPIGRRCQLGAVILLLIVYAFLTGGRPSVVRATIMMIVFLVSLIIEKEPIALNTLFLAALIILVYNPLNLFDVGFQLSFVCVFSILYLNLRFRRKNDGKVPRKYLPFRYWITQSLTVSLAIWIGVAGLIAYYFGIITPVTIFANLLVVPLISVIVSLGFGLLIVGLTLPAWAPLFAACLKVTLNTMVGLIFLCDKIPFSHIYVEHVRIKHVALYYIIVLLILYCPWEYLWFKFYVGPTNHLKRKYAGRIDKQIRV